jgi:predicted site-specific integrase-resolvase
LANFWFTYIHENIYCKAFLLDINNQLLRRIIEAGRIPVSFLQNNRTLIDSKSIGQAVFLAGFKEAL